MVKEYIVHIGEGERSRTLKLTDAEFEELRKAYFYFHPKEKERSLAAYHDGISWGVLTCIGILFVEFAVVIFITLLKRWL